jgi:hypothetical protein
VAKSKSRLCWLKNSALTDCANSPALDMSAARKLVAGLARPLAQRAAPRAPAAARSMSGLGEQLGKVKDVPLKDAPGFIASQRNDPKTQAAAKVRFECRPCPLLFSNDELWTRALALPPPRRPRAFLYVEADHSPHDSNPSCAVVDLIGHALTLRVAPDSQTLFEKYHQECIKVIALAGGSRRVGTV